MVEPAYASSFLEGQMEGERNFLQEGVDAPVADPRRFRSTTICWYSHVKWKCQVQSLSE